MSEPECNPNTPYTMEILVNVSLRPPAKQFAQMYDLIVLGRAIQRLPARWTTRSGKRPANPHRRDNRYTIITPALVQLERQPLVDRLASGINGGQIIVATEGGQVGRDSVTTNDPYQQLEVGNRVILGLEYHSSHRSISGAYHQTPAGPTWTVGMTWILEDEKELPVTSPHALESLHQELIDEIVAAGMENSM